MLMGGSCGFCEHLAPSPWVTSCPGVWFWLEEVEPQHPRGSSASLHKICDEFSARAPSQQAGMAVGLSACLPRRSLAVLRTKC